jgi:D-alanyl-D-alanine dipeptidase
MNERRSQRERRREIMASEKPTQAAEAARLAEEAMHEAREAADCAFEENAAAHLARMSTAIDRLRDLASRADSPVGEVASQLARDFPPMGGLTECDMGDSYE